ncbi:hypothetical protein Axi01nite_67310 [Actinoplanes xinjiangensis]|nr:hypothetical protein Axi01nite_67310 [Actinoplanes xinjiangensis]
MLALLKIQAYETELKHRELRSQGPCRPPTLLWNSGASPSQNSPRSSWGFLPRVGSGHGWEVNRTDAATDGYCPRRGGPAPVSGSIAPAQVVCEGRWEHTQRLCEFPSSP